MSTGVNDPNRCRWCEGFHTGVCPTVKAIEYHPDGTVKRVEFKGASDYAPLQVTEEKKPQVVSVGDTVGNFLTGEVYRTPRHFIFFHDPSGCR